MHTDASIPLAFSFLHLSFSLSLSLSLSLFLLFAQPPNLIDDARNFSSLYFRARGSPVGHPTTSLHRIPCLYILSSLFCEVEDFSVHNRFCAIAERAYRLTKGKIIRYRLFNQVDLIPKMVKR